MGSVVEVNEEVEMLGLKARELSQRMQEALQERDWERLKKIAEEAMARLAEHPRLFPNAVSYLQTAVIEIAVEQDPNNLYIAEIARVNRILQKIAPL